MAKIEKLKKDVEGVSTTIYPVTIPQAVIDPTSGKSAREELDEKANHGYDSAPKTLKAVDEAKVDKTSIVGETGQGETSVMSQKAVTDELGTKASHGYESSPKTLKQVDDSISQLASEVSLLDAVQGAKIKDIESVISTMNPNQSVQLSVSGRKTISLPKNASNGGMSVKLEGLTAENLIVNGDFSDGVEGWSNAYPGQTNLSVSNNILSASAREGHTPYYVGVYQSPTIGTDDILYMSTMVSVLVNKPIILINDPVDYNLTPNVWTKISKRRSGQSTLRLYYQSQDIAEIAKFTNVIAINLTQTFGAGNEPTKEECDKIFGGYFEGVKSFEPTGRVRSVGRNLFDKSKTIDGQRLNEETGDVMISSPSFMSGYIRLTGGQSYILRAESNSGQNHRVCFYDAEKKFISGMIQEIGLPLLFTAPFNAMFLRISSVKTSKDSIMLKKSSVDSIYEPYKETSLYLTSPELRSNGTVKDEIRKGANGYELVKRISEVDGTVLANPVITPISYGGVLNSAENGTVYHEPIIADAGVYSDRMGILLTDYPIASIEEIIKHENGVDTYLNVASAVIASDGLSFTHPDLASGDLVLFTYAYDKESTNGNITATFYDSNVVKIDTVTGKAYKIEDVVTNGVLTRTLTEV